MSLFHCIPDVENLQQPSVVRDYQERIQEALMVHSLTHYPSLPHKHADQLTRLAELTRTCALGRELLKARQAAGEVPQFSLLSELLKGVVGTGEGTTEWNNGLIVDEFAQSKCFFERSSNQIYLLNFMGAQ